jgi:dCTP deaminase
MILSDTDIINEIKAQHIVIKDFDEGNLQPASYDLCLGKKAFRSSTGKVHNIEEEGSLLIEPAEFVEVITHEVVEINSTKICARVGLRSSFARKGLLLFAGPQVDPGFRGCIIVTLFNTGGRAIRIGYKERFCTIEFLYLKTNARKPYSGRYQDQTDFASEDIVFLAETKGVTLTDILKSMNEIRSFVTIMREKEKKEVRRVYLSLLTGFSALLIFVLTMLLYSFFRFDLWLSLIPSIIASLAVFTFAYIYLIRRH